MKLRIWTLLLPYGSSDINRCQSSGIEEPNDWLYPLATLGAIGPKDELEALLAVQRVGHIAKGWHFSEGLRRRTTQQGLIPNQVVQRSY